MKTQEINYTTAAILLAAQMVEKGMCEFTVNGGVYGGSVKHISIDLMVPKWTREGTHYQMSIEFTTDLVGQNKKQIQLMHSILDNGFESIAEYAEAKAAQIAAKKAKIKALQRSLKSV